MAEVDGPDDAFLGDWLVTEHVFDPGSRVHLGDVRQRRTLAHRPDGTIRITQICTPDARLAGQPMAGFAGEWVFAIAVDGRRRRYLGPDVVGEGTEWAPGAMTGAGRWPRFGHDFTSWSAHVAPGRQLTGGTFSAEGRPVAVIVGVAVAWTAPGEPAADDWPSLDPGGAGDAGPEGSYGPYHPGPDGGTVHDRATGTTVSFARAGDEVVVTTAPPPP
jgi:hypothetical protein